MSASRLLWCASLAMSCMLLVSCRAAQDEVRPSVTFAHVPEAASGGSGRTSLVAGSATGARTGDQIVLFARSGVWWVQPLSTQPLTPIAADGTWRSTTHLGTEYAALLVTSSYRPPATLDVLPTVGDEVRAVATVAGTGDYATRSIKTVTFSGYEWEVRDAPSDRGGANYYDGRNVHVDAEGRLHLRLTRRDGRWTGAEVSLTRALGYGTYVFVVTDVSRLEPSAVLGLLTWDAGAADQNHRELDVEFSRWGYAGIDNAQYVVQPYYVPSNVRRFTAPPGRLTHTIRWEPGRAAFSSRDERRLGGAGRPIAAHVFRSGVPEPGDERVRIHLYPFAFSATPVQRDVEVTIEKFQYLP